MVGLLVVVRREYVQDTVRVADVGVAPGEVREGFQAHREHLAVAVDRLERVLLVLGVDLERDLVEEDNVVACVVPTGGGTTLVRTVNGMGREQALPPGTRRRSRTQRCGPPRDVRTEFLLELPADPDVAVFAELEAATERPVELRLRDVTRSIRFWLAHESGALVNLVVVPGDQDLVVASEREAKGDGTDSFPRLGAGASQIDYVAVPVRLTNGCRDPRTPGRHRTCSGCGGSCTSDRAPSTSSGE